MKGICVGMGGRGRTWYRWAKSAGMDVVGIVDLNEDVLNAGGDELEVPKEQRFTHISDAAAATGATVAAVCTANSAHFVCIRECLDAGLHLIIEKPMVESLEQAKQVVALAAEKGKQVAVAQNYRYTGEVQAMRRAIRDGLIGKVMTINVMFARWRPAGDMVLPLMLNQAIHHFDAARYMLGSDPSWCFARSWNPADSPSTGPTMLQALWGMTPSKHSDPVIASTDDDRTEAVFSYQGNYVHQGEPTPYSGHWRVTGTTGTLTYLEGGDGKQVILTRREPEERIELELAPPDLDGPAAVCRSFLRALGDNNPAPTRAADNIKSLGMIWAAQASSDRGAVVSVPELIG